MADMIKARAATGANVYAIVFNSEADVWDTAAFVPYATVDLASYALSMTELGVASGLYVVAMPAVAAGLYSIVAFVRVGGSPAETDTAIGAADADWDGTVFSTLESLAVAVALADAHAADAEAAANSLKKWVRLLSRNDAAIATDHAAELTELNSDEGSGPGTFDNTTDSVQALAAGGGGLDAAGVRAAVGLASANLDTQLDALPTNAELATALGTADDAVLTAVGTLATAANLATAKTAIDAIKLKTDTLPDGITKNAALANFTFFMASSTDHVTGATGLTVTATRSLDGAAFAACANAVSEVSGGWYKITLAAGDLNGDIVALLFSATGADARALTLKTEA